MTSPLAGRELPPLRLYNTLGRTEQEFVALNPPKVLMYTCGPTVYHFTHIGNMRSFLTADVLRRVLEYNGYEVTMVKNITDVGHLRDDEAGAGPDRIEAAAEEQGLTPAELVEFYTGHYIRDEADMNLLEPAHRPKATDHISGMIEMAQTLVDTEHAYATDGNVYFDVTKFDSYGKLSGNRLEDLVAGQRVEIEPDKRNPADFALWKAGDPARVMNWPSPWSELGFPGWHIECSVMASDLLGPQIDIHTGGIDNLFPHHEDERAQSEAATGQQFVGYWVHTAHLLQGDEKMSRSLRNFATVSELKSQGIHPLAFRFFLLQGHYRKKLSWSTEAVEAAQSGLDSIWDQVAELLQEPSVDPDSSADHYLASFGSAINDDLGTPRALAILQGVLESESPSATKLAALEEMDTVLGLRLLDIGMQRATLDQKDKELIEERKRAREARDWAKSDSLRDDLNARGIEIRDSPRGQRWINRRTTT